MCQTHYSSSFMSPSKPLFQPSGSVPNDLKIARVVPVYKLIQSKRRKTNTGPYLFYQYSQKFMKNQHINGCFNPSHNVTYENQYGFLHVKSTTHALINFTIRKTSTFLWNFLGPFPGIRHTGSWYTILHIQVHHYGITSGLPLISGSKIIFIIDINSFRSQLPSLVCVLSKQAYPKEPFLVPFYFFDLPLVSSNLKCR